MQFYLESTFNFCLVHCDESTIEFFGIRLDWIVNPIVQGTLPPVTMLPGLELHKLSLATVIRNVVLMKDEAKEK